MARGLLYQNVRKKDCGPIENPPNGERNHINGTTYLSETRFTCHPGYTLYGDQHTRCNENGHWTKFNVTCVIKDCGQIGNPSNGERNHINGTTYLSETRFTCHPGYTLHGDQHTICEENGQWRKFNVTCVIKDEIMSIVWAPWGPCSLTCGQGSRIRVSECISIVPGKECDGNITESQICRNKPCIVSVLVTFETTGKMYHEGNELISAENIPFRIPYWNSEHNAYRPNWNGFITLDAQTLYGHHGPQTAEEWKNLSYGHTVIAPLWTKLDDIASDGGGLEIILLDKYRSSDLNNSEQTDLKTLGDLFSNGLNLTNFKPRVALVATWKNVSQWLPLQAPGSQENHFSMQVILISDGMQSYLMFNYEPEKWSLQPLSYAPAAAGFSLEDQTGYIIANNGNLFQLNNRSNVIPLLPGRYIYNVSGTDPAFTAKLQNDTHCLDFYHNVSIRHFIQSMHSKSEACHCSEAEMKLDFAFHPVPSMLTNFRQLVTCYEAWFFNQAGVKQTCCYREGNLSTHTGEGGFATFEDDPIDILDRFYECCLGDKHLCHLFYELNPPDDCSRYRQEDEPLLLSTEQ